MSAVQSTSNNRAKLNDLYVNGSSLFLLSVHLSTESVTFLFNITIIKFILGVTRRENVVKDVIEATIVLWTTRRLVSS